MASTVGSSHTALSDLGLIVIQRDWLSANHVVFPASGRTPATLVDTGYGRHAAMTIALVDHALGDAPVQRIINTHLHSDHCGGNHAFQRRDPSVQVWVPSGVHAAAASWDHSRLSYMPTGQFCERFRVDGALSGGDGVQLGEAAWQVHAAPGHDPDALMLFEPQTRTLIAGDALWEDRLAIIFPELESQDGFGPTAATLAYIEQLKPRTIIPGHGAPFSDVEAALQASRHRLAAFSREPQRHTRHAARALLMFHLMEVQSVEQTKLQSWLTSTPLFQSMCASLGMATSPDTWAIELVEGLLEDGLVALHQGVLKPSASPSR